jgi:hypothetical protein
VAYGKPRDGAELSKMPREEMMKLLTDDIGRLMQVARKIQRK